MSEIKKVDTYDCTQGFKGFDLEVELYKPYKFVITFENTTSVDGYVSKKIIIPLLAGCIPIYYGNDCVREQFITNCFINAADFQNSDHCIAGCT